MVSINQSDEQLFKNLDVYNIDQEDKKILIMEETARGRAAILSGNQSVIRIKTRKPNYETHSVIAHEVFHSATFIMDRVGMKLKLMTSDEAYAYLIGFITQEIYKKLKF